MEGMAMMMRRLLLYYPILFSVVEIVVGNEW